MKTNTIAVDIYKDMLEKLKYHKEIIMHAFIKHGYYPSNEEVKAALEKVNSRLSLFEAYISRPGSYFNYTEINYCFDMIAKDIEILYRVIEEILTNELANLKLTVETALSEIENKAKHFSLRREEEINTTALGTTIYFQATDWKIDTLDQTFIIDLGTINFIEGIKIACIANVNDIDRSKISFKFENSNKDKSFYAEPYNHNNMHYYIPGQLEVNNHTFDLGETLIINDEMEIDFDLDPSSKYELAGGKNFMKVTSKRTGVSYIEEFPLINGNGFYAAEECYIEFFITDGTNGLLEYSFNMAPEHTNFSLQNGYVYIDKQVKRIYIDAQPGLSMAFNCTKGDVFAEVDDVVNPTKNSILYNGHKDIRDLVLREYVRSNLIAYNVKVYIDSTLVDITDSLESIVIKEI